MDNSFNFKHIYPSMRHAMGLGRKVHGRYKSFEAKFKTRNEDSKTIPKTYGVCNTNTINSDFNLNLLSGTLPQDIDGNLYICQCLGTPGAFMVGDTNLVKINFSKESVSIKNRLMWNPVSIARMALRETKHKFDYFGLMFLSPGLGMSSYTEGMYLLPDGRLGITSDVDRPWIVDRETLKVNTPLGTRKEWLPMMSGSAGDAMGKLFSGYSNSHVIYTDTETNELFLVNYQYKQADGTHPCQLMKWDGKSDLEIWNVVDENGKDIQILQSIHELIFTRDYIILADTAFVAGMEMLTPWKNAPLPNKNTVCFIVDRRDMKQGVDKVVAKRIEVEEACIHLIADYENPDDKITMYMLHTPATNTAEIIKHYDVDMNGNLFAKNLTGYGTLPVLDLSSVGKHVLDMKENKVEKSQYITDEKYCWGPYMYTYMGRQTENFIDQDLFVMFKGFAKDMLPKRIYKEYKDVENRRMTLEQMLDGDGLKSNNSIARIDKKSFEIADAYELPDKVLLYTISCLESNKTDHPGYLIAGVVQDVEENEKSSGHEYWIFKADELSNGPMCKLGHKDLNNTVLFHTVYINSELEEKLNQTKPTYNVPIREDYPEKELKLWQPCVKETFEKIIYPYYENETKEVTDILNDFSAKRIDEHAGYEHLIGEEFVTNAPEHAEKMIAEANRMFKTTGWKIESNKNGVLVESKPVCGVFESANVCVTRATAEIEVNAKAFFDLMVSPEGYAIIDPVSDSDDHKEPPLEIYNWKENSRLEAALATTKIPGLKPSDFIVLNAIDGDELIFVSKSILHEKMPGGSKYSNAGEPNGNPRALNTFVVKVVPISDTKSKVLCINYADMAGKTSAGMNNFVNKKAFFPPLYKRMKKHAQNLGK